MAKKKEEMTEGEETEGPMSIEDQITKLTEAEKRASSMYMETGDAAAFNLYKEARDQRMQLIQVLNQRQTDLKRLEMQQQQFAQLNYNPNNVNMDRSMATMVHQSPLASVIPPSTIQQPTQNYPTPQITNPGALQQGGPAKKNYLQMVEKNMAIFQAIGMAAVIVIAALYFLFK
jgi:hypothetical protein